MTIDKHNGAYERYTQYILNCVEGAANDFLEKPSKAADEAFRNRLFDLPGPKSINRVLNDYEKFFQAVFYGYVEISKSITVLDEFEILIRRFPYSDTKISRTSYLSFLISSYLNEVYILDQRLQSYLNVITKAYRNNRNYSDIKKTINELKIIILEIFDQKRKVRGRHVHYVRYTDEDIDRIDTLQILIRTNEFKSLKFYAEQTYKKLRKKWVEIIKNNNRQFKIILDAYFHVLLGIVFDDNNNLRLPTGIRG